MTDRTPEQARALAKRYMDWQRKVRDWQPGEFDKAAYPRSALHTAKAVALFFGLHTDIGEQRKAVGDATIATELGLDRHTVARYRQLLVDYGVLVEKGKYRRAMALEPGRVAFHDPPPFVIARRKAEAKAKGLAPVTDDPWANAPLGNSAA